jgi:hypothetical protein
LRLAGVFLVAQGSSASMASGPARADWAAVRAPLAPWLDNASLVLTSHDVETLYWLGRYDIVINANRISEIASSIADPERRAEFGIDRRTGRPVISEPDSLRLLMSCYPDGLIVTDAAYFRRDEAIVDSVADLIEAETVLIDLPPEARILAFRWEHSAPSPVPAVCAALPQVQGPRVRPGQD